jgi:hypothetical protein
MVENAVAEVVEILAADGQERSLTRQGSVVDHVERILYALAWRMQSSLDSTLPLGEAFALMKQIRGDREYSLEELTDALVQRKLLAIEGRDSLRFAYSRIQAYCCAQAIVQRPDRQRRLVGVKMDAAAAGDTHQGIEAVGQGRTVAVGQTAGTPQVAGVL